MPLILKRLLRTSVILVLLGTPVISLAQIEIVVDTLMRVGCNYDGPKDLVIDTQEEYEHSFFDHDNNYCVPFGDADMTRYKVVGFRYRGSNCDKRIESSSIIQTDDGYLIQFAIVADHACRDLSIRTVWFLLEKPSGEPKFTFARVAPKKRS